MTRITSLYNEETDETIELPFRWEICRSCDGHGKSSRYLGAITCGDREPGGAWEDPEDFEDYMNGAYDKVCDDCDGTGKVRAVDVAQLRPELKERYETEVEDERQLQRLEKAERDFGC